jgi:enoyl-CoA hydratase/carnithine racemase
MAKRIWRTLPLRHQRAQLSSHDSLLPDLRWSCSGLVRQDGHMSVHDAQFTLLSVVVENRVCWATINAPPVNVMTIPLLIDLMKLAEEVEADDGVGVLVLQSADPEFFIAHFDVEAILRFPTETEALRSQELSGFHRMCETFRTMPKATIAKINGRVGGGGAELAASFDMRFGVLGRTVINQMEVPLGILPGGTGTQRLPWLVGRGRALEMILGGIDVDAETALQWGWLNRAFATTEELDAYVAFLANRMASFPSTALRLAKASVLNALDDPTEVLLDEAHAFQRTLRDPLSTNRMRTFLERGGQTREGERDVAALSGGLHLP